MTFSFPELVDSYGYAAILVGTFLEGETILVLGGIAAKLGYLELPWVVACAFLGSFGGDQLYFHLGRRHGGVLLARHPEWEPRRAKVQALLARFRVWFILGFRFAYGLRTVSPFVLGMSDISAREFFLFNALGALLWAATVGAAGYAFGHTLDMILGDVKRYEAELLASVAGAAIALWVWRRWRRHRAPRSGGP